MPTQPDTPRDLDRTGSKQRTLGSRFLLAGGILFALGVLLLVADENALGSTVSVVAALPTMVGLALFGSGVVASRAAKGKPFV